MSHNCKSFVIHCMDYRLGRPMKEYLEEHKLLGDCDIVSLAGGVKGLVSPDNSCVRDYILSQIGVSVGLHSASEGILSNHTDCGAYGGSKNFDSMEAECEFHIQEMEKAKEVILGKYPELKIRMVLGKIMPKGGVEFQEL